MIRCSFCEQPLACKNCQKVFRPLSDESHLGVYQPDVAVPCPECRKLLVCKSCGFAYGEDQRDESLGD